MRWTQQHLQYQLISKMTRKMSQYKTAPIASYKNYLNFKWIITRWEYFWPQTPNLTMIARKRVFLDKSLSFQSLICLKNNHNLYSRFWHQVKKSRTPFFNLDLIKTQVLIEVLRAMMVKMPFNFMTRGQFRWNLQSKWVPVQEGDLRMSWFQFVRLRLWFNKRRISKTR